MELSLRARPKPRREDGVVKDGVVRDSVAEDSFAPTVRIATAAGVARVQRRHVLYVEGYEPRGAKGYYKLFRRECDRFQRVWPVALTITPGAFDADDFARWHVGVRSSNWQVSTSYDFLRLEDFIRSEIAAPMTRHIPRALGWIVGDILSGAQFRIFRASWRFGLHLLFVQMVLLAWLGVPAMAGIVVASVATNDIGLTTAAGIVIGAAAALASFLALKPIAARWGAIQIPNCWVNLRRFGRGRPTWLDHVIEVGARHLIAVARANDTDEIVVVGHSAGGVIASAIMTRALEIDPDVGHRGPRLVLLTLGSVMPAVALHPAAQRMRDIVKRLAVEPTLAWIDCQSRKDVMTFLNFDPIDGIGVDVGAQRRNPLTWRVRFKDMLLPEDYRRLRWQFFRAHFQYIMAGDRPSPYDYILLIGGPVAIAEWAKKHEELTLGFIRDGRAAAAAAT